MNRLSVVCLGVLVALPAVGCAPNGSMAPHQARVIENADANAVLAAAAKILRREFGRIRVDPEARTIDTEPVEFRTTRESGTARDLYGGRSTMRRRAHFSLGRRGGAVVARLRVDVERQDTARVLTMQPPTGRVSDTPAYTPIERDAATTERQNTVWTHVRRDRRLERLLLQELSEEFAPQPEAAPATAPPSQPAAGGGRP